MAGKSKSPKWLRVVAGYWHYRFTLRQHEYTGNTGLAAVASNVRAAQKIAQAEHAKGLGKPAYSPAGRVLFAAATEAYLTWADTEHRNKPATARRKRGSFRSISLFFADRYVDDLNAGDVERYKQHRAAVDQVRDCTLANDLNTLSNFFRYARRNGWLSENPASEVKRPSTRHIQREHVLSAEEEAAYFTVAKRHPALHDAARLILLQGCRPEEVTRLRVENVDLRNNQLRIQGGKTAKASRSLPLTAEARNILTKRIDKARWGWLFPSPVADAKHLVRLNQPHDDACRDAQVAFVLYDLRHTFGTRFIEAGGDVTALRDLMGHASITTTLRYVHLAQAHLQKGMKQYEAANKRAAKRRVG